MSNLKKSTSPQKAQVHPKTENEQDHAVIKERVSKSVDDFYRRHGKVMTKLAYE